MKLHRGPLNLLLKGIFYRHPTVRDRVWKKNHLEMWKKAVALKIHVLSFNKFQDKVRKKNSQQKKQNPQIHFSFKVNHKDIFTTEALTASRLSSSPTFFQSIFGVFWLLPWNVLNVERTPTYSFLHLTVDNKYKKNPSVVIFFPFFLLKQGTTVRHGVLKPLREATQKAARGSFRTDAEGWCRRGVRRQVSSECLVCGSRSATSPAVRSRKDTSRIGTAQLVSTSLPKTMFPVMAATRPTPVKKPRAEELEGRKEKGYNSGKFICCNQHAPKLVLFRYVFFFFNQWWWKAAPLESRKKNI